MGRGCDDFVVVVAAAVAPWAYLFPRLPALELQFLRAVGEVVLIAAGAQQLVPAMAAGLSRNVQAGYAHVG